MAKSNPIGVRFNLEVLKTLKDMNIANTPQEALKFFEKSFLTDLEKIPVGENTGNHFTLDLDLINKGVITRLIPSAPKPEILPVDGLYKELIGGGDPVALKSIQDQIAEYEIEKAKLPGVSGISKFRKSFLEKRINELKKQL